MIDRSKKQEEKPNMAGRLGQVLYWAGCSLAVLSIPVGALKMLREMLRLVPFEPHIQLVVPLLLGTAAWFTGLFARYILKGDWPDWISLVRPKAKR